MIPWVGIRKLLLVDDPASDSSETPDRSVVSYLCHPMFPSGPMYLTLNLSPWMTLNCPSHGRAPSLRSDSSFPDRAMVIQFLRASLALNGMYCPDHPWSRLMVTSPPPSFQAVKAGPMRRRRRTFPSQERKCRVVGAAGVSVLPPPPPPDPV